MADKVVNRRISIYIDQDSAVAAQQKLQAGFDKSAQKVKQLQAAGKDATAEIAKMASLKDKLETMNGVVEGRLTPSFNMVKKSVQDLRRELTQMSQDAPGYAQKFQQFQQVNAQFAEMKKNLGGVQAAMQSLASQVKTIALGVLVGNTIQAAIQQIGSYVSGVVQGNARLSDSLADIRRVTGMTAEEVTQLYSNLRQLDTRTATSGLLNIAVIAGKLGIDGVKDLTSFVAATDKLQVALGDELGDADQITTQLGKILNVFGDGAKITGDALLHVGNAVVDLANKGVATGGFIVDFTQRLSGLAGTAKLALPDVLGLAAGLEESGQRVEASSTAVIKVITKIASDVPAAAKIAGKSAEDFANTLNAKPLEALLEFAQGLQKNKNGFAEISAAFKDAGEDGSRIITTLGVLGSKADFFREKMNEAGISIKGTDQIMAAFNLKNETLAGQLDKLGKKFYNLITSSTIKNFLTDLIKLTSQLIDILGSLGKFISDNIIAIGLWTAAIVLNQTARLKSIQAMIAQKVATIANTIATNAQIVATTALSAIQALLAGNITKARQEFKLLTLAMGTNPLSAILIAVGALVVLFNTLINKSTELTAAQRVQVDMAKKVNDATVEQISKMQTLTNIVSDNKIALDSRKTALQELININPKYLSGLTLENATTAEGKRIINDYVAALKEKAEAEAASQVRTEKLKEQLELQLQITQAKNNLPGVGGAVAYSVLTQVGVGPFAKLDELQEKFKKVTDDIAVLDAQTTKKLEDNVKTASDNTSKITITTIADLKAKLKALEADFEGIDISNTKALQDNIAKRKALQAQIDALEGKAQKNKKAARDKDKTEAEKLADDLRQIASGSTIFNATQYEKDIIAAYQKYAKLDDRANKYIKDEKTRNATLAQIADLRNKEIAAITQKYLDKAQKKLKPAATSQDPISQKETNEQIKQFTKSLQAGAKNIAAYFNSELEKAQLEVMTTSGQKRLEAEYKLLEAEKNKELDTKHLTEEGKAAIEEKYRQLRKDAENTYLVNSLQTIVDWAQQTSSIFDSISQIQANKENAELARDKKLHDQKVANLDTELSRKLITQQQYDRQLAQLNADYDKKNAEIQKKQFERQKKMQITEAFMSAAQAVISTLAAKPGALDIISLGAFRAISIALIAATTAAKIGDIASSEPPAYGEGGRLNGPTHASRYKGMPVVNPQTGRVQSYLEGGEGILKATAMADNKRYTVTGTPSQIASALNASYGGVSWSHGATLTPRWMSAMPTPMNVPNIMRSMERMRMYASGGIFKNDTSAPSGPGASQTIVQGGFSPEQFNMIMAALNKKTKAYVVLQEINDQQNRMDNINNSATLRG